MKIRIQNQKLIYRLQNEDISILQQNKYCQESLHIAQQQIVFALKAEKIERENILLQNNSIEVIVPEMKMQEWINSEQIEMEFMIENTTIIVEKDLKDLRRYATR